jgi:glycosyltransferase involved in cell wall biosynthesis
LEVLVVDDASPDDTAAAIGTRQDPRLRYYRNERNLGRVANYRHSLYDLASGEWVVNLDGDDYFTDRNFISAAIALAIADPLIRIVAAGCLTLSPTVAKPWIPNPGVLDGRALLEDGLRIPYLFKHMSTLYHRRSAMDIDFYRHDVLSSDWESLFRLAIRSRVAFLPRSIGVWRLHGGNASSCSDWRTLAANIQIWPVIYADAVSHGMPSHKARRALRKVLIFYSYLYGSMILASHGVKKAFNFLAEVWRIDRMAACRSVANPRFIAKVILALLGRPWGRAD